MIEFPKPSQAPALFPALTIFSASRVEARRGMPIIRTVTRSSTREGSFTIEPSDRPETATISPLAPFHGTAGFHAAPGEAGKWEGAITVELPGAGTVQLTGAAFETQLCLGRRCVGEIRSRRTSKGVLVMAARDSPLMINAPPGSGAFRGSLREEITEVVHQGQMNGHPG